jgi:hypothetical protein
MCVLAIPSPVHAQSAPSARPAQPSPQQTSPATSAASDSEDSSKLPVSLDRIRDGLQRDPKLKIEFLDPTIPLFRTSVQEKGLELSDYWKIGPDTAVSRMVRPSFASRWHHDFLSMTTPKQHIAASPFGIFGNPVHPVGLPTAEISQAIKGMITNVQRARIRRQIQAELKAIDTIKAQQVEAEKKALEAATPKTPPPDVPNDRR